MRKIKKPKKKKQSPTITWEQEQFLKLYKDVPASELPDYSLAECVNILCWGAWAEVRPGTRLWAASNLPSLSEEQGFSPGGAPLTPLPSLAGRADYEATKSGDVITKTVGQDFTEDDIGCYFVWPDGYNDLIVGFVDADSVEVRSATERAAATSDDPGRVRGPINGVHWHDHSRRVYFHIDTRVFYTDYQMLTYTEIYPRSLAVPANIKSDFDSNKNFVFLFANGVFQIDTTDWEMYKINEPVPWNDISRREKLDLSPFPYTSVLLDPPQQNGEYIYGRRYLYSMSRLDGSGERNRGTLGVAIRKETGTNVIRTDDQYIDYREVWYRDPPYDDTGYTSQLRIGAAVTDLISDFQDVIEGSFSVSVEVDAVLTNREVVVNLGNAKDFKDVAEIIEAAIIATFPDADGIPDGRPPVCRFVEDHFIFHGGHYSNSQCSVWGAGTTGTDISGMAQMTAAVLWYTYTSWSLGTEKENALKITDGQRQWTHYSVYSSRFVEDSAIDDTQYVWQQDVPIARAYVISGNAGATTITFTATRGKFTRDDIGSFLKFEDGTRILLQWVNNETDARTYIITNNIPEQAACIGDGNIMTAEQRGYVVTRISGDTFSPGDVGKTLFWSDDGYSYVVEYISQNEVRCEDSCDRTRQGMTWDPVGRNYNDRISDNVLQARQEVEGTEVNYFILKQRFWTALPDTPLGRVGPLFMYVAQSEGQEIFYSTMAPLLEYLGGHFDARYQRHAIKDAIIALGEYPDKLIIYCSKSTQRIQTNVTNQIVTKANNIISVISGVGVIDSTIGIKYKAAVRVLENGHHVVITSEPAIRIFDGFRYSPNIAQDEDGEGFIQKDIQRLQTVVSTGYDRLFGFIIWGQDQDENVVDFNRAYRVGLKKDQPDNWMEFGGQWPNPEIGIGTIDVFDDDDRKFTIVFEANSGLPYMIASRQGPIGSNIEKVFVDKIGTGYDRGYEIPWSAKLKEHRGKKEEDIIRHLETHVNVRPQEESNKGASGYDVNGFRNAQEISVRLFENGNVAADAVTNNIPNRGDITVDKQIDANRIQIEIAGTASELKITSLSTKYEDQDLRGAPSQRVMQEQQYQDKLSDPTFWWSRGDNPMIDRATGNDPTGNIFDYDTGPDGDTQSAFVFANTSELEYAHTGVYGDFTIMFGLSNILTSTEIFRIGDAIISVNLVGGVYMLEFNDGVNSYDRELNWDGSGWVLLKLTRSGEELIYSENGAQLDREMLTTVETVSGNIVFPTGNAKQLYDVRVYDDDVEDDAFEYYYRDVTESEGFALLW